MCLLKNSTKKKLQSSSYRDSPKKLKTSKIYQKGGLIWRIDREEECGIQNAPQEGSKYWLFQIASAHRPHTLWCHYWYSARYQNLEPCWTESPFIYITCTILSKTLIEIYKLKIETYGCFLELIVMRKCCTVHTACNCFPNIMSPMNV